ncbi:MAG: DNA methyltransferase [Chloroflexi bacterium]|nr:DNA methyltransferase [Chloroflexota bacterium]
MPAPNFTNRTVWVGDNLHVMRGINSECIDLIYLDPPFNSNQDYAAPIGSIAAGAAFKDTWTLSDIDVHEHGELADRNPAAYSVIEAARNASGKSMMSYLIMMAVRLIEMERILKPTGSIYLHCDPTASHYLKLLLDAVFGGENFRNEITWKRTSSKGLATRNLPTNHDILLRYSKSAKVTWNPQFTPHDPDYVNKFYKYVEEESGRRYRHDNLVNPNRNRPNLTYEFLGVHRVWRWTKERMQKAYEDGIVIQTKPGNVPVLKRFLDEQKGRPLDSIWTDIPPVQSNDKDRTGYPTQKPIALLDRIIEASSNEGDIVFDPFCGCATTLVAADRLERQWAGIDLSPLALKLVNERISEDRGALWGGANVVETLPKRTDLGELPNYRTHRHRLYGEQEGLCLGCDTHFPFKVMEVDHILPKSRGGTDHIENLQLLCTHCNKSKGSRTMAEWRAGQALN